MIPTLDARNAGFVSIADFRVGRIGFGARWLSAPPIWPDRHWDSSAILRRVLELGVGLIDTANVYGAGVNEVQIAQALRPYASSLLIATKGGMVPREPNGALGVDCNPVRLRMRCEESLERLGRDHIDLYQLHLPDPKIPWPEQVGALRDLRDAGKIRHVGLCNVTLDQLIGASAIVPISTVQNSYDAGDRCCNELLSYCESRNIVFLVHRPFNGGKAFSASRQAQAAKLDLSLPQLILGSLLRRSPNIVPIPGTAQIAHLEENIAAAGQHLSDDAIAALDES